MSTVLLFGFAAAAGAVARFALGLLTCTWQAILIVNTVGAAVLGWTIHAEVSAATLTALGTGFCGTLTTYSSFALESRSLGWRAGSAYVAVTLCCVTVAASIGTMLA